MNIVVWLTLGLLFTAAFFSNAAEDFEEEEDDVEDGVVENEEEPVIQRERPVYEQPVPNGPVHFHEPFNTRAEFLKRWLQSQAKKDGAEEHLAKYDGKWSVEEPRDNPISQDLGLILKSKAKHHAIAAKLDHIYEFTGKPFIAQYEVKFQNGMDCGGAYIKLLSKSDNLNLKTFTDKTPYTIMFGPDKCGNDHKLHFIFRHKNPKTGEYEEKHAEKTTAKLENFFTDRKTHLYTLTINPDNTYEIKIDNGVVSTGSLLNNVSPPVNPPEEIEDPDDKKPAGWDDREKIVDPGAKKPEDWDETEPAAIVDEDATMPDGWLENEEVYIPDPSAMKPDDWDDEMDGEWEAPRIDNPVCKDAPGCGKWERPTIPNPKHKGSWKAPMIDNPNYKGEWKPKRIPNPNYYEDKNPYKMTSIEALGLELWSMTDDILFDNFIISDNVTIVEEFTAITWEVKSIQERASSSTGQSIIQAVKDATNERPWLWAVFILVVILPIVLIITYCCTSVSKGWWQAIKSSTDERPWLWAVYVMVLLLPIVLLSICLCPKSGPVKPEDIDAHKKKFDDPSPDVIEEEEAEASKAAKEEGEKDGEKEEGGRGDEKEEGGRGDELAGTGGGGELTVEAGAGGDSSPAGEQADEGDDEDEDQGSPKKSGSPRKRRTRKE